MVLTRRAALAGGLSALAAPSVLRAAETARREFRVTRGGSDIGSKVISARRSGERTEVEVSIRLAVKVLGITAYRYELDAAEVWEAGLLQRLDGETNDDGDREIARVRREGDRLIASGAYEGELPSGAGTTSYWSTAFLDRGVWISTQTGSPLDVTAARDGSERIDGPSGPVECARWRITGDLPVTLLYDGRGEWLGNRFDASGEPGMILATSETGRLAPLWPAQA